MVSGRSVPSTESSEALTRLSVQDAVTCIKFGALSPLRYVDTLLQQLAATRELGGVISCAPEALRRSAAAFAEGGRQPDAGPLYGVPIIIKDNVDVAGVATTAGSLALKGAIATEDAPIVVTLLKAGALILGKANMHEFAVGITNNNGSFGPARNPSDPTRIPGGSSGGTAVVIASRAAPAGIGTDTGGSLRIPAALCGVVGFRPTVGRWSSQGIVPISPTLDTPGPMARTVSDCALLDAVVTGDSTTDDRLSLTGLRIGVPRAFFWEGLDGEMLAAGEAALEALGQAGAVLVDCEVPGVADLTQAATPIALSELLPSVQHYCRQHHVPFDAEAFVTNIKSPDVRGVFEMLMRQSPFTQSAYEHARDVLRPSLQRSYLECFRSSRIDALIFPTTPLAAVPIGEDETTTLNGAKVPTFATFIRNTSPGALAGLPGISVPMSKTRAGLPQGIELDGPAGSDRRLLAIANLVEKVLVSSLASRRAARMPGGVA